MKVYQGKSGQSIDNALQEMKMMAQAQSEKVVGSVNDDIIIVRPKGLVNWIEASSLCIEQMLAVMADLYDCLEDEHQGLKEKMVTEHIKRHPELESILKLM